MKPHGAQEAGPAQGSVGRTPLLLLKPEGQDVSRPLQKQGQRTREESEDSLALLAPAPLQARLRPSTHSGHL